MDKLFLTMLIIPPVMLLLISMIITPLGFLWIFTTMDFWQNVIFVVSVLFAFELIFGGMLK